MVPAEATASHTCRRGAEPVHLAVVMPGSAHLEASLVELAAFEERAAVPRETTGPVPGVVRSGIARDVWSSPSVVWD